MTLTRAKSAAFLCAANNIVLEFSAGVNKNRPKTGLTLF